MEGERATLGRNSAAACGEGGGIGTDAQSTYSGIWLLLVKCCFLIVLSEYQNFCCWKKVCAWPWQNRPCPRCQTACQSKTGCDSILWQSTRTAWLEALLCGWVQNGDFKPSHSRNLHNTHTFRVLMTNQSSQFGHRHSKVNLLYLSRSMWGHSRTVGHLPLFNAGSAEGLRAWKTTELTFVFHFGRKWDFFCC